jgi:tetratricopeptide (TPR) repeat protein
MRIQLRSIIKIEIEQVFGRRLVSSRDCMELSDEVFLKTKERLNQNTLRRFFGLVKSEYPPSQSTLSILSKYCGFETVEEAYKVKEKNPEPEKTINTESVLHYLIAVFKDISLENLHDKTFLNLVKHTIEFTNTSDGLADKFQSYIVHTGNGSEVFFEHMGYIDKLNSYYGRSLRYYVQEKGTVKAKLFTNSLNVLRFWLNKDDEQLERITLNLLSDREPQLSTAAMSARYFAAILLHNNVFRVDNQAVRIMMEKHLEALEAGDINQEDLFKYCYIIAEAFALTGQYADALLYIEKAPKIITDPSQDQSVYYYQCMKLMHCYSLFKIGDEQEAEKILSTVKPADFHFLQKKLCNIFYLYLLRETKHSGKKYQEELLYLIEETGFVRLKGMFN